MMYRKDLFDDPKGEGGLQGEIWARAGIPADLSDAKQVAEFFTRPDQGLYGWGQMGGRPIRLRDLGIEPVPVVLWRRAVEPATHEVKGYLNSPASIQGVQAYVDMFKYGPPGSESWDWDAVNSAFQQGHLAMAMQWYYFDGSNSDPKVNPLCRARPDLA